MVALIGLFQPVGMRFQRAFFLEKERCPLTGHDYDYGRRPACFAIMACGFCDELQK
jgi:hypothetical protein